jgi:hypothetical protein
VLNLTLHKLYPSELKAVGKPLLSGRDIDRSGTADFAQPRPNTVCTS